jgi:cellulose synthase/poly-beta-1,6-N-acetylglucosamine synthase-like glycosyltransferase/ribosomal protein S18 acetylase RimI-like enzyme
MAIDLTTLGYSALKKGVNRSTSSDDSMNDDTHVANTCDKSVSVLIPLFNEAEKILSTIDCIIRQTYPVRDIYLLDDLSTDRTKDVCRALENKYDIVSHVRRDKKLGKAGNINTLVSERAHELGEFVLIVDGDVKLEPPCLEELVKDSGSAEVVTGFGYTKKPSSYVGKMLYEGRSWVNSVFSFRKKAQAMRKAVFVVCGALCLYRKDILKQIPIPERTLTEDTDYTWLLQERGYTVSYNEKARAVGSDPESFRGCWKRHVRWFSGTYQSLFVHGFRELQNSKRLLYSTILPGCLEAIPYSVTITFLPVIALYSPALAKGILTADLLLSAPFLFLHQQGFWHAVNHLPDIYAYKYFGSVACLYSGMKTTVERVSGRTEKWKNSWENSSRANMQPRRLTKRYMRRHLDAFLYLEKEWADLGEEPWTKENFMFKNPKKWKLSSHVSLNGKPVGYTIVSETSKGLAYLHKILVDSDYQRLGIGSLLLGEAKEKCRENKIKKLYFKVRVNNERANGLYRKNNVVYTEKETSPDGVKRYLCELDPWELEINQNQKEQNKRYKIN